MRVIGGSLTEFALLPGTYAVTGRIRGRDQAYWGYETPVPSPANVEFVELAFNRIDTPTNAS